MNKLGRKKKKELQDRLQEDINKLYFEFIDIHHPDSDFIDDIEKYTKEVILLLAKAYN